MGNEICVEQKIAEAIFEKIKPSLDKFFEENASYETMRDLAYEQLEQGLTFDFKMDHDLQGFVNDIKNEHFENMVDSVISEIQDDVESELE